MFFKDSAMKNYCETGMPRVQLYMKEKQEWQEKLSFQNSELPRLEEMLKEVSTVVSSPVKGVNNSLNLMDQINKQKLRMKELNTELEVQQWRLENDTLRNPMDALQVLCTQDILRERIKYVEKKYADLKCSLLKYIPVVL